MVTAGDLLYTNFVKVDANDSVAAFLGSIKKKGTTFGLIFDGKSYVGFADKKELLRSRFDASKTKIKHALKHVPLLSKSTKLADVVRLMAAADTRALPVRENDKIIGVVTAKDVVKELKDFFKTTNIVDVMKRKIVSCGVNDALGKVISSMVQKNVDRMPVVDVSGNLVGVVSFVDVLTKLSLLPQKKMRLFRDSAHSGLHQSGFQTGEKQGLLKCPVANVMSEICYTCNCDSTITDIIETIGEHDVSSVIIVKDNKPVGVITVKDLFEFYRKRI